MSHAEANARTSTVTLHMVSSLDGIVASKDNSVSWMDSPGDVYEKGVPEGSANADATTFDCFVLGSRTYEHALQLGWPYGDSPTVVLTHRKLQGENKRKSVEFYSGDLKKLVHEILAPRYKSIWLVGGAILCRNFLKLNLVDEISLVIMPVLLGDGLRLFDASEIETRWHLKNVVAYKSGAVELLYRKAPSNPV